MAERKNMKKIKYINIVFVLAMLLGGVFANAEEVGSSGMRPDQKPRPERAMIKDKIEQEKMIRLENKDVRPIKEMRDIEKQNPEDLKARIEERKIEREGKIEERKIEREGKMEEKKNLMQEKKKNLAEEWKMRAQDRLNAGKERLTKIIERLESRMIKIEEQGGDTARAKTLIASAKSKLEKVDTLISDITNLSDTTINEDSATEETTSNTDLKQNDFVKKVKPIAEEIQKLLKGAHQDLVDAVKALKEDNKKEKPSTDSSVSTQNSGSENNEQVQ